MSEKIKTLRDIQWLLIGSTDEYAELKKWIAHICRDVTKAGCIDELCISDIVVGFDQKGYSVVRKEDLESLYSGLEYTLEMNKALSDNLGTLRIELDKADGAGQELMGENERLRTRCAELESRLDIGTGNMYDVVCAENERLRARCAELVEQCNKNYDPLRKQIEEQGLAQAGYEYATQIVIDDLRATVAELQQKLIRQSAVCIWSYDDDDGYYGTECGRGWTFIDGGVTENDVKYCPHCGRLVAEGGVER